MRFLQPATLGVALALSGASAHAQNIISRQVVEEPVETTVTQTPTGTMITRRPLGTVPDAVAVEPGAPAPYVDRTYPPYPAATRTYAAPTYVDETVEAAPAESTVTVRRTTTHTVRASHAKAEPRAQTSDGARRTTRTTRTTTVRRVVGEPLVLDPAQRRIVYRTIVQEQVMPAQPAYPARTFVVPSTAGSGYAVRAPMDADDDDDVVVEQTAPGVPVRYTVGSQLPADVVLAPVPVSIAAQVPAVRPYRYVTLDNRVLLVDPATNTVVADITP